MTDADPETLTPDICVIGAGSGGLTVAAAAAAFGVSVVLIEKGKMGGDCLNYGCVPSKALIAAAKHAAAMRSGAPFGVAAVEPEVDFSRVRDHIREVIASIEPHDSQARFEALGVRVIRTAARFIDADTVVAGGKTIRARRFVIAAGSSPRIPDLPGLGTTSYLTNETVFELGERPERLAILGGGPIGIELAQAFRRLGSAVTVFEAGTALGREDPIPAAIVLGRLRAEGVELRERTKVTRIETAAGGGVAIHVEGVSEPTLASHLLVTVGRVANTGSLGLDEAGIAFTEKGVTVTAALRTTNRRVYAIGDIAGGPQFTHLASHHASLVVRQILFRVPAKLSLDAIPRVTFTDPELAHVGLAPGEAGSRARQVLDWPLARNDRAGAERQNDGMIRIVTGRAGRILGVSIVAPQAGEMIHLWTHAVAKRLKIRDMLGYVPPYPTTGEIGRRAAVSAYEAAPRNGLVRAVIGLLRRMG